MTFRVPGAGAQRYFRELGDRIATRWTDRNFSEAHFVDIAEEELGKRPAHVYAPVGEVLDWVAQSSHLPPQFDIGATFGRPPLTVYAARDFHIDILFWTSSTTSIHQHGFSGVFSVLSGSSVHSVYDFEARKSLSETVRFGRVTFRRAEVFTAGDRHRILPGERFIHALFHLDEPSVSLVVRTDASRSAGPQFTYYPPFLAFDPFFRTPDTARTLQFLEMLVELRDKRVWRFLSQIVDTRDFLTAWRSLLAFDRRDWPSPASRDETRFERLLDRLAIHHNVPVKWLRAVLSERRRVEDIIARRRAITDSNHRLLLALILNVPSGSLIQRFVKQRFPNTDPVKRIVTWLGEMGDKTGLNLDANMLLLLDGMLRGKSVDGCLRPFVRTLGQPDFTRNMSALEKLRTDLAQSLLLRGLFS